DFQPLEGLARLLGESMDFGGPVLLKPEGRQLQAQQSGVIVSSEAGELFPDPGEDPLRLLDAAKARVNLALDPSQPQEVERLLGERLPETARQLHAAGAPKLARIH